MNFFKTSTVFLATAALMLSFGSCKKETTTISSGSASGSPSKTSLLTNGGWLMKSFTLTQGSVVQDVYDDITDPCSIDDITIFNTNNFMTLDQGAVKCDAIALCAGLWSLCVRGCEQKRYLHRGGLL